MVTPPFPIPATPLAALGRLCACARGDSGQARRAANFLLAWHNAEENGGWDPADLWQVDQEIALDMLAVLEMAQAIRRYPGDLGFAPEIEAIWRRWRAPAAAPRG